MDELYRIKEYRRFGLSLKEIKQIITGKVDEKTALAERNIQLEHEIRTSISVKTQLEEHMTSQNTESAEHYEIVKKVFAQKTVLFRKENIEVEHLGIPVGKLHELAVKNGLIAAGSHYVRYDNIFDENGDFTMETCLPVMDTGILQIECVKEEKTATCIYTVHKSGFSTIGKAHQKIKEYVEQQHMELTGKAFEVYNRDMSAEVYYEIGMYRGALIEGSTRSIK